jgi:hypothetical protein
MPEYSLKQLGIVGQYDPELCAVSGRPIRGKHAVTHYKGDNVHYVRVLNQFDHLWPESAEHYGFPVPQTDEEAVDEGVFVVDALKSENAGDYLLNQANPPAGWGWGAKQAGAIPGDNLAPTGASTTNTRQSRMSKPSPAPDQIAPADSISKGDD